MLGLIGCSGENAGGEVGSTAAGNPPALNLTPLPKPERVKVATAGTRPEIRSVLPALGTVRLVGFSNDGKTLVVGEEEDIAFWDVASGKLIRTLGGQPTPISATALNARADLLVTAGYQFQPLAGLVKLWSLEGKPKGTIPDQPQAVDGLSISSDGRLVAVGTSQPADPEKPKAAPGGLILVYELGGDAPKVRAVIKGHSQAVNAVAMAPDGSTVASISMHRGPNFTTIGELLLWDVAEARERAHPEATIGRVYAVTFNPDGKILAAAYDDAAGKPEVALLDSASAKPLRKLEGLPNRANTLAFNADGSVLALGFQNGSVALADVTTGAVIAHDASPAHRAEITSLAFSDDGQTLASGGKDRVVHLWNVKAMRSAPMPEGK